MKCCVMSEGRPQFVVAQLGARMHYAVPRILSSARMLAQFYTDTVAPRPGTLIDGMLRILSARSGSVGRLRTRLPDGIATDRIRTFQEFGWEYAMRLRIARLMGRDKAAYLWAGRRFSN